MHIHLDGIIFSLQAHGGITVYFRELLKRFSPEHQATLTLEMPTQQEVNGIDYPSINIQTRMTRGLERVRPVRAPVATQVDVFHSSYYRLPQRKNTPTVVTVHDFVHEYFVPGPRGWMRRCLINSAIAQAHHIICISESTRADLMRFAPLRPEQQVSVIPNGVANVFRPLPQDRIQETAQSAKRPFLLFVGQRGGYKNFALALRALEHLPDLELHCVGGGTLLPEELVVVPDTTRSRVRHLGFVDDDGLNSLYNNAHALIYPSAYEGFGIPVLEAMRAGCPVVSISCKAVIEVGGDALSISQDTYDPVALADAVRLLDDKARRETLRRQGLIRSAEFSWDRCFSQTLSIYRRL